MFDEADVYARTRSIPTAAALIMLGHRPLGIEQEDGRPPYIVFPAHAAGALNTFIEMKDKLDAYVARETCLAQARARKAAQS